MATWADADGDIGDPSDPFADPRPTVIARLRACRDLDEVLALAPPRRLVAALFGPNASRTLTEPLGDAVMRSLAHAEAAGRLAPPAAGSQTGPAHDPAPIPRRVASPLTDLAAGVGAPFLTLSSVVLAAAASGLLDAGRLAEILAWDDEDFHLVPVSATDLDHDLRTVLRPYRSPARRLTLLATLWDEQLSAARRRRRRVQRYRAWLAGLDPAPAAALGAWLDAAPVREPGPGRELVAAALDSVASRFRQQESLAVKALADDEGLYALRVDSKGHPARADVWEHLDNCMAALRTLRASLTVQQALPAPGPGRGPRPHRLLGSPVVQERLEQELLRLAWRAAADPDDADDDGWVSLYDGYVARLFRQAPDDHVPYPPVGIPAAVAQVAQLMRFGADPPPKPPSWEALLAHLMRPFFEYGATEIAAPAWTERLQGRPLPTVEPPLNVRLPRTMRELLAWADFMGNCIASVHGERIATGRTVMLGLFAGDELRYNVSAEPATGRMTEINSRFNAGGVPEDVLRAVRTLLVATATAAATGAAGGTGPDAEEGADQGTGAGRGPGGGARWRPAVAVAAREQLQAVTDAVLTLPYPDAALLAMAGGAGTWTVAVAALEHQPPGPALRAWLSTDEADLGALLDALLAHPLDTPCADPTLPADVRTVLERVRTGDDRARLARPLRVLARPPLEVAWRLARLQQALGRELGALAASEPVVLARAARADRGARARWPLAVLATAGRDEGRIPAAGRRSPGWVAVQDRHLGPSVWREAHRLGPDLVQQLLVRSGYAAIVDIPEPGPGQIGPSGRRAGLGLAPIGVPRIWLT